MFLSVVDMVISKCKVANFSTAFIRRHSFALSTTVNSFILNPLMGNIGSLMTFTSGTAVTASESRSVSRTFAVGRFETRSFGAALFSGAGVDAKCCLSVPARFHIL
jgi:hypothetical protein